MSKYETHTFNAPCGVTFKLVLSRSTYSVAVHDRAGHRIAWTGRQWGCALTDALSMAAYTGEPLQAETAMRYLFVRIDGAADCPGLLALWQAAMYRGETSAALRQDRESRICRKVASVGHPVHADAMEMIARQAIAPRGMVREMIAAGSLRMTANADGAPAFEVAA